MWLFLMSCFILINQKEENPLRLWIVLGADFYTLQGYSFIVGW